MVKIEKISMLKRKKGEMKRLNQREMVKKLSLLFWKKWREKTNKVAKID